MLHAAQASNVARHLQNVKETSGQKFISNSGSTLLSGAVLLFKTIIKTEPKNSVFTYCGQETSESNNLHA